MGRFKDKIRDRLEEIQDRYHSIMGKLDLSAMHLALFFGILSLGILLSIKVLSSKYFISTNSEVEVLNRVMGLIENTLSKPGACAETLNRAYDNYYPRTLRSVKSGSGYVEFQVEQKPTNNFEFIKFSAGMIDKVDDHRVVLLKFSFKNLISKKIYTYRKILVVELKNKKIFKCNIGPKLRIDL